MVPYQKVTGNLVQKKIQQILTSDEVNEIEDLSTDPYSREQHLRLHDSEQQNVHQKEHELKNYEKKQDK